MPAARRSDLRWTVPLFVAVVAVHASSWVKMPGDSAFTLQTAQSILEDGDVALDEYLSAEDAANEYAIVLVDGVPHNYFPLGPSLWALPAVAAIDGALRVFEGRSYRTELLAGHHSDVQEFLASCAVAWAAVLVWLLARNLGLTRRRALLLACLFAFGTSAWSAGSRALWPHGPSLVWLGLALWSVLRAEERPRLLWLAGLALALAYVTRPTNAVAVVGLTAYALLRFRTGAWPLLAAGAAGALLFAWHNLAVYGALLPPYFQPSRLADHGNVPLALAGNLVSPGRGLLVFTPVLLFAGRGWWLWRRDSARRVLADTLLAAIAAQWVAISLFPHWWAGWSYGPRFFTDTLVFFSFLLVPVVRELEFGTRAGRIRGVLFVAALVWGIVVHGAGANLTATMDWNGDPANIDHHPERVWDWSDPQFTRWRSR